MYEKKPHRWQNLHAPRTLDIKSYDTHLTRFFEVISCIPLTINAIVCDFNDMLWNFYDRHEKLNDMVFNYILWDLNKTASTNKRVLIISTNRVVDILNDNLFVQEINKYLNNSTRAHLKKAVQSFVLQSSPFCLLKEHISYDNNLLEEFCE